MSSRVGTNSKPRPNRRQVAAEATRREILTAARRLFAGRGYAAVSVAEIAEEAGVSIPTVYASVGPKPAIARSLGELVNTRIGVAEFHGRLETETDPVALLKIATHVSRAWQEQFGDIRNVLRAAAPTDQEIAELVEFGDQAHRYPVQLMAERLRELDALRPGVSVEAAAVTIGLLTEGEIYELLANRYGWDHDRTVAWLDATLQRLLLR